MKIKSTTHTIDGIKFEITNFSSFTALKIQHRLISLVAAPFGQLIGAFKKSEEQESFLESKIDGDALTKAISELMTSLDFDTMIDVMIILLVGTRVYTNNTKGDGIIVIDFPQNKKDFEVVYDTVFDDPFTIFKLLGKIITINWSSFFDLVGNIGDRVKMFTSPTENGK